MKLWSALVAKEWALGRSFYLDYAVITLIAAVVLPAATPFGFAAVATLFATALGARIGGEEALQGTWEFVLTRPVDRRRYVTLRFLLGLLPLCCLAAFFALASALDLHHVFSRMVASEAAWPGPVPFAWWWLAYVSAAAVLCYALTFAFAQRATEPAGAQGVRVAGFVSAAVVLAVVGSLPVFRSPLPRLGAENPDPGPPAALFAAAQAGMLLLAAAAVWWFTRSGAARREVAGPGEDAADRPARVSAAAVAIVIALFLALGLAYVLAPRSVSGPVAPAAAPRGR